MPLVVRCLCPKQKLIHVHRVQNKAIVITNMEAVVVWVAAAAAIEFFYLFKSLTNLVNLHQHSDLIEGIVSEFTTMIFQLE